MLYIPIRSDAAANLSKAIYQLTQPPAVRDPANVSCLYCAYRQHPTRPEVATLEMPESETIPIHSAADGALLQETLAPFVGVELTQEEASGLVGAVQMMAGQRVSVADLIPQSWQPYVMDRETALTMGWLSEPGREMATTTLLNAVSANTTGSGASITGDFEALVPASVNLAGGEIVLQAADSDTPARPSMAAANDDIVLETSSDGGDNWTLTNSAKGK